MCDQLYQSYSVFGSSAQKKWLSDSDICVGDFSIRKLEEFFKLIPKVVKEYIRGSVLSLAPTRILNSRCDLDIL
jgi:hypothetical protein